MPGMIGFHPRALTVTEPPAPPDFLEELQDQLFQMRNDIHDTRTELADLQGSADGKLGAWAGYAILGVPAISLVLEVFVLLGGR